MRRAPRVTYCRTRRKSKVVATCRVQCFVLSAEWLLCDGKRRRNAYGNSYFCSGKTTEKLASNFRGIQVCAGVAVRMCRLPMATECQKQWHRPSGAKCLFHQGISTAVCSFLLFRFLRRSRGGKGCVGDAWHDKQLCQHDQETFWQLRGSPLCENVKIGLGELLALSYGPQFEAAHHTRQYVYISPDTPEAHIFYITHSRRNSENRTG